MGRFLILDIGAGTMDVLYYDTESGVHYKAVTKSPVLAVAEKAAGLTGDLLITGTEMGGGTLSEILRKKARESEVVMSVSAAATLHHQVDKVLSWGVRVVDDGTAEELDHDKRYSRLTLGDLEIPRLEHIVNGFGVPFSFDVVGICAQDHGVAPAGVSHLDYRHNIFKASLDKDPFPHSLLYRDDQVPGSFSRLRCICSSARGLPAEEIYVMDSGMAAILGASMDPPARHKERILTLDIATSHTVGAALENGELAGFFEYHTHAISVERLDSLLADLADGNLTHDEILKEGGHGAYIRKAFGFRSTELIIATGPRRAIVEKSRLPMVLGSPLGDNMMTGTVGVWEAIRRRKCLNPISSL